VSGSAPRISVVVIVRDGERFLAEALDSIRAQTETDWEAIVVDDGSRDGTAAIAAGFVARDPSRFRLVAHPGAANRGMSASRNLGVAHARGTFVTFLDHDDAMLPEKLARQSALLERHRGCAAVIGPNIRWHSWRGDGAADGVQDLGVATDARLAAPGLLPVFLVRTSATPQSPMVRREAIDAVGGFDEAFTDMYEDQVFLAKLFLAHDVWIDGVALHRYRQHADSCVNRAHREGRHRAARRRYLRWLRARLAESGGPHAGPIAPLVARELRRSYVASLRALLRLR
jgi:glycosyltransferase involved in cell wall biosynthesis